MENKVLCIGELLIDFICSDINVGLHEGNNFIKKAGGAPANVAAAISKLGGKSIFAGKVGNDAFGLFLKNTLIDAKVDTSMLILDSNSKTTLAFVSLKSNGERDFVFNRGAEKLLRYEELNEEEIKECKIVHFGSATALLGGPSKDTYLEVMELAHKEDIFIAFDPNYRVDLWKGRLQEFIEVSKFCLKYADFVKVSDEEIKIISEQDDLNKGLESFHSQGAKFVAVTLGAEGALISNGKNSVIVPSVKITSVDSTGAGDAFVGAVLLKIAELEKPKSLVKDFDGLKDIIAFGNKVGALVCTNLGAIAAIPSLEEVGSL